jgi:hypothetical protein
MMIIELSIIVIIHNQLVLDLEEEERVLDIYLSQALLSLWKIKKVTKISRNSTYVKALNFY